MFFIQGDYIMTFFGTGNSLFSKVSPNICKNLFLNLPNFFPVKHPSWNEVPRKKDAEMYSEPSPTSKMEYFGEIVITFSCKLTLQRASS